MANNQMGFLELKSKLATLEVSVLRNLASEDEVADYQACKLAYHQSSEYLQERLDLLPWLEANVPENLRAGLKEQLFKELRSYGHNV